MDLRAKLKELDLALPDVPAAVASYVPALRVGDQVLVSGQLPMRDGRLMAEGPVPAQVSLEDAQAAARQCVLNGLAAVDQVLEGDWSRFVRVARLAVYVHSDVDFILQHKVANGASDLLTQVFGEAGQHVRAAVGAPSLPLGASVEAELSVQVRD